jgi:hypothetical protein
MNTKIFGDIVRKHIVALNERPSKTLLSTGKNDQISQVPNIRGSIRDKLRKPLINARQKKVDHKLAEEPKMDAEAKPELEINKDDEREGTKGKKKKFANLTINPEIDGQPTVQS